MAKTFDGSNDNVTGTITAIAAAEQWTMFAWIRLAANLGAGASGVICELGTGGVFRQHFGVTRVGSANVLFGRQDYNTTDARKTGGGIGIVAGDWYFVAAQFDFAPSDPNPRRIHLYIGDLNDELAEDTTPTLETFGAGTKQAGGTDYAIGSQLSGASWFNGQIGFVGVVPYRIPLSSMRALRQGRRMAYVNFTADDAVFDQRLILPFDSTNDAGAEDVSGYANHGTVNGAVFYAGPPVPMLWAE